MFDKIPEKSGVYFIKEGDKYLYIGKAINLKKRVNNSHPRIKQLKERDINITFELFDEKDIGKKEKFYIKKYKPEFNGTYPEDGYKIIRVDPETHKLIKLKATKKGISIKKLLKELIKKHYGG